MVGTPERGAIQSFELASVDESIGVNGLTGRSAGLQTTMFKSILNREMRCAVIKLHTASVTLNAPPFRELADMNMIAHCRAMAAVCRQHAQFENENTSFWLEEAEEWGNLIAQYSIPQPRSGLAKLSKLRTFYAE
jgi:hypothetical protein